MKTVKLPAHIDSLAQVISIVVEFAKASRLSPSRIVEVELAVDEAFTNVCRYAYDSEEGEARIRCFNDDDGRLVVEVVDQGKPFDPLSLPEPVLSPNMEEREVGGLGVFLIRKLADKVEYSRSGNRNILRLSFYER